MSLDLGAIDFETALRKAKCPEALVEPIAQVLRALVLDRQLNDEMEAWDRFAAATIAMAANFTGEVDEIPSQAALMADRMMAERKKRIARLAAAWTKGKPS